MLLRQTKEENCEEKPERLEKNVIRGKRIRRQLQEVIYMSTKSLKLLKLIQQAYWITVDQKDVKHIS